MLSLNVAARRRKPDLLCGTPQLTIRCVRRGETHVVALAGELDLATVRQLEHQLERVEQTDAGAIVLDLRDLQVIDSAGMHVLIRASARSRTQSGRLTIVRGPDSVHRAFEICGLASRLPFVDHEQALTSP